MVIRELRSLVQEGEHEVLEFKRKVNHPDKIMKEVVAFANTRGGKLLIGVSDDGVLAGNKNINEDVFVLEQAIKKYIKPRIHYSVEVLPLNEKVGVAVFSIEESPRKPHYVIENFTTRWGTAYVRVAASSIKASREMREILKRSGTTRDTVIVYGEYERWLLQYLEEKPFVTLDDFAEKGKVRRRVASRILVVLALAGVLRIEPREGEPDRFTFIQG